MKQREAMAPSAPSWFVRTRLAGLALLCAYGCQSSQPQQPTAADLSKLKLKCGEESLSFSPAGRGQVITHFNEQNGRCYVEQIELETNEKLVFDAETHTMLVQVQEDASGSTGIMATGNGAFTQSTQAYGPAKEKIKELMQQDAK